jgi:DTW domain-containing protein YfiP
VVQQIREHHTPTNTGRLVPRVLVNAALIPYGEKEIAFDPTELTRTGITYRLLFPAPEAVSIAERPAPEGPVCYGIPDGTWHQCRRMRRRVEGLQGLEAVALPPGPDSIWPGRRQVDPAGLSTFEAAARLVEYLHGEEIARPMHEAFERLSRGLAFMKGLGPAPI